MARKKRRVEESGLDEGRGGNGDGPTEAFDYTTAPSVMNAPRTENERTRNVLNISKKALDAPKGLPKKQKEKSGRSATWTS